MVKLWQGCRAEAFAVVDYPKDLRQGRTSDSVIEADQDVLKALSCVRVMPKLRRELELLMEAEKSTPRTLRAKTNASAEERYSSAKARQCLSTLHQADTQRARCFCYGTDKVNIPSSA
jgi:hypothetical protein